jgi:hypothetical protein
MKKYEVEILYISLSIEADTWLIKRLLLKLKGIVVTPNQQT